MPEAVRPGRLTRSAALVGSALGAALLAGLAQAVPLPHAACCTDEANTWEMHGSLTSESGSSSYRDLWSRLSNNLQLTGHLHRAPVRRELNDLVQHLPSLFSTLEGAEPYLHFVLEEVQKRNLPAEVALLPLIESKYEPHAQSIYGAAGIWQFMPSTARHYGLRLDWWFDGRRDVNESTRAALDYIEHLAAYFNGDWLLAIASYNTGQGRVSRLRNKQQRMGLSTDFWSLELPRETRRYVPTLLALAEIIRWGQVNGYSLPAIPNKPYLRVVDLPGQADLLQLAEMAEMDVKDLFLYNAGFRRWSTLPEGPHRITLPRENADLLEARLAEQPSRATVAWDSYLVKPGDSLQTIAEMRNVDPAVLRQLNDLADSDLIRTGESLLIPQMQVAGLPVKSRGGLIPHKVRPNQTLEDIARRYGVSRKTLLVTNRLPEDARPKAGSTVRVFLGPELPDSVQGPRVASYKVRSGDSLSVIARRFKTTVDELVAINALTSTSLLPGWELRIPLRQEN